MQKRGQWRAFFRWRTWQHRLQRAWDWLLGRRTPATKRLEADNPVEIIAEGQERKGGDAQSDAYAVDPSRLLRTDHFGDGLPEESEQSVSSESAEQSVTLPYPDGVHIDEQSPSAELTLDSAGVEPEAQSLSDFKFPKNDDEETPAHDGTLEVHRTDGAVDAETIDANHVAADVLSSLRDENLIVEAETKAPLESKVSVQGGSVVDDWDTYFVAPHEEDDVLTAPELNWGDNPFSEAEAEAEALSEPEIEAEEESIQVLSEAEAWPLPEAEPDPQKQIDDAAETPTEWTVHTENTDSDRVEVLADLARQQSVDASEAGPAALDASIDAPLMYEALHEEEDLIDGIYFVEAEDVALADVPDADLEVSIEQQEGGFRVHDSQQSLDDAMMLGLVEVFDTMLVSVASFNDHTKDTAPPLGEQHTQASAAKTGHNDSEDQVFISGDESVEISEHEHHAAETEHVVGLAEDESSPAEQDTELEASAEASPIASPQSDAESFELKASAEHDIAAEAAEERSFDAVSGETDLTDLQESDEIAVDDEPASAAEKLANSEAVSNEADVLASQEHRQLSAADAVVDTNAGVAFESLESEQAIAATGDVDDVDSAAVDTSPALSQNDILDTPAPAEDPDTLPYPEHFAALESVDIPKDYVPANESGDALYQLRLRGFEGPLDLLLFLIKKHKIDVFDIPVAFICDEYLGCLHTMQVLNIDVAAEFLMVASELLHLKSKMLLPKPAEVEDEEEGEDPRIELVRRLLEYQKYKAAAGRLGGLHRLDRDVFARDAEDIPKPEGERPLKELSVFALIEAFSKVLERQQPEVRHQVMMEKVSVRERIDKVVAQLLGQEQTPFAILLEDVQTRLDLVATFLAILEMTKLKLLRIYESENQTLYLKPRFERAEEVGALLGSVEDSYAY